MQLPCLWFGFKLSVPTTKQQFSDRNWNVVLKTVNQPTIRFISKYIYTRLRGEFKITFSLAAAVAAVNLHIIFHKLNGRWNEWSPNTIPSTDFSSLRNICSNFNLIFIELDFFPFEYRTWKKLALVWLDLESTREFEMSHFINIHILSYQIQFTSFHNSRHTFYMTPCLCNGNMRMHEVWPQRECSCRLCSLCLASVCVGEHFPSVMPLNG